MDIRKHYDTDTIIFADDNGGTGKALRFERNVPVQFNIRSAAGQEMHIKHADIDHVIKALHFIKEHWGEPKEKPT